MTGSDYDFGETTERYPSAMTKRAQWMCQSDKKPYAPWSDAENPYSWSDPENWTDFDTARSWASKAPNVEGTFAFLSQKRGEEYDDGDADPFLMVDGDDVRDPETGEVHEGFREVLDALGDTFVEVSRSGGGVHAYYEGELPEGHRALQFALTDDDDGPHVEIYDGKRVFVVTGDHVPDSAYTIQGVDEAALEALCEDHATQRALTRDPDAEPREFDADPTVARDKNTTTDEDEFFAVIADLSVHEMSMRSTPTQKRADGSEDWDPSWETSESGTRLGIADDGRSVIYRNGNVGGDALDLVAWEERITRPGERLEGGDFFDAVDAARDRGANIPKLLDPAQDSGEAGDETATDGGTATESGEVIEVPPDAPPDADDEADEDEDDDEERDPWMTVRLLFADEDTPNGEAIQMACDLTCEEFDVATLTDTEVVWTYDADKGIFESRGEQVLRSYLSRKLGAHVSRHVLREIIGVIEERTWTFREDFGGPDELVAFSNCVLDLSDPQNPRTAPHHPGFRFIQRFENDIDPTPPEDFELEEEAPEFARFLDEVVRDEDRLKLQEYAGYLLHVWGQPYKRALVCIGPTDSGKSTFLNILRSILGEDNCASESLYSLVNTRWGTANLYGSPVNMRNELSPGDLQNPHRFKEITSGQDPVDAEFKGQDKFTFVPTAKHVFATNQVPQVENADDAFHRRWLFASFPTTIPVSEQDRTLATRIVNDEANGVLNWMLAGYARLRAQDRFSAERTIEEKEEMWASHGDSVDRFLSDCIEATGDHDDVIPKDYLYDAYVRFSDDKGLDRVGKGQLTQRLKREQGISDARRSLGGEQFPSYVGLKTTDDAGQYIGGSVEMWVKAKQQAEEDDEPEETRNSGLGSY